MYWEDYDTERIDLLKENKQITRKEHECCECGGKIREGELCWHIKGRCGRDFAEWNMCAGCYIDWELIIDIYYENREDACVVYGMLGDAVQAAFEADFLQENDSLIRKWLPDDYEEAI